jgi:hypothetical protein
MQRALASAALVLAACFTQAALAAPAPQQQNGINYINGGVGQDEQNAMQALRADYNLQLTYATQKTGAFRSDVQTTIADAKGNQLLSVANTGPLFYAHLPAGTYRISAAAEGKVFKRTVKVGTGVRALTLHWENDSQDDPGPQD